MRSLMWMKETGAEYAEVDLTEGLAAEGTAVNSDPIPYRLEYSLRTSPAHVTQALAVRAAGAGWVRTLDLRRVEDGKWTIDADGTGDLDGPAPGGSPDLSGALDCDLGMSPLTNTMPVLRHGLLRGGERTAFVMAWVRVPHLEVIRHEQWYTPLGPLRVRYESAGFSADLTFDQDGL